MSIIIKQPPFSKLCHLGHHTQVYSPIYILYIYIYHFICIYIKACKTLWLPSIIQCWTNDQHPKHIKPNISPLLIAMVCLTDVCSVFCSTHLCCEMDGQLRLVGLRAYGGHLRNLLASWIATPKQIEKVNFTVVIVGLLSASTSFSG